MTHRVKAVSTYWGHGSNFRVHFSGYSLFLKWVCVRVLEKGENEKVLKNRQNPRKTQGFPWVLARPERFELPAFWSVGALTVSKQRFLPLSRAVGPDSGWSLEVFTPLFPSIFCVVWVSVWVI